MKGETRIINGDRWTVVDVAPAGALAEMVAAILEDEGFVVVVRGADRFDDVYSHLGAANVGTTLVLVPESDAERALALIEETVTDYEGEDLERILQEMGAGASPEDLAALGVDFDDTEEQEDDETG